MPCSVLHSTVTTALRCRFSNRSCSFEASLGASTFRLLFSFSKLGATVLPLCWPVRFICCPGGNGSGLAGAFCAALLLCFTSTGNVFWWEPLTGLGCSSELACCTDGNIGSLWGTFWVPLWLCIASLWGGYLLIGNCLCSFEGDLFALRFISLAWGSFKGDLFRSDEGQFVTGVLPLFGGFLVGLDVAGLSPLRGRFGLLLAWTWQDFCPNSRRTLVCCARQRVNIYLLRSVQSIDILQSS